MAVLSWSSILTYVMNQDSRRDGSLPEVSGGYWWVPQAGLCRSGLGRVHFSLMLGQCALVAMVLLRLYRGNLV